MTLKVFTGKNQATNQAENSFFRAFASSLAAVFENENREGLLLGHPVSLDDPSLQMDCLLITPAGLVIVDFKDTKNAVIHLPSEDQFRSAQWQAESLNTGDFHTVQGGYAKNPFEQLLKKFSRLSSIVERIAPSVPIFSHVVFHGRVKVSGEIPGKYAGKFSIDDGTNYTQLILDSVNLRPTLTSNQIQQIFARFHVRPYSDVVSLKPEMVEHIEDVAELSLQLRKLESLAEQTALEHREAQNLLRVNQARGEDLAKSQRLVDDSQARAERAQADAQALFEEFEQKNKALETAREIRLGKEAEVHIERSKTRRSYVGLVIALLVIVPLIAAAAYFLVQSENVRQETTAAKLAAQHNGQVCVPVEELNSTFVGDKNVCVVLTVNDVISRGGYPTLKSNNNDNFQVYVASKSLFSIAEGKQQFLGKRLEVRGDVTKYEDQLQVTVTKSNQITLVK